MAFWLRLKQSNNLKLLSHQFKTSNVSVQRVVTKFSKIPFHSNNPIIYDFKIPSCEIRHPVSFNSNFRSFATSLKAKTNKGGKEVSKMRLNEQITALRIRLVSDEGHQVVPTRDALEQARKLKLDLVQVDGNANPPVCKMMDFNKENYKRHMVEKERVKSKLEVTLKKGDCKEVRFSTKTGQNDLKIKADSVLRLMQRGYRVKCMAQGSSRKGKKGYGDENLTQEEIAERLRQEEEEENKELTALLSQLTALIEDDFIIDTGPWIERKQRQACIIVRHAKFGSPKKGGAKKSKDVGKATSAKTTNENSSPIQSVVVAEKDPAEFGMEIGDEIISDQDDLQDEKPEDDRITWSVDDSTHEFESISTTGANDKDPSLNCRECMDGPLKVDSSGMNFSIPIVSPRAENRSKPQEPLPAGESRYKLLSTPRIENRYSRIETGQQFSPGALTDGGVHDRRDSFQSEPRFPHQNGQPESQRNATSFKGENKPAQMGSTVLRNTKLHPETQMQRNAPGASASGFGIFSSPKTSNPKQGGTAEASINSKGQTGLRADTRLPNSNSDSNQRPGNEGREQARWGIFSRDSRNPATNSTPK